jgi:hypothetical protein
LAQHVYTPLKTDLPVGNHHATARNLQSEIGVLLGDQKRQSEMKQLVEPLF